MARDERLKALDLALSQIEKDFGKEAIMRLGEKHAKTNVEVIPTGALPLDIAIGIGGIPRGRVVEIFGPEASGKTTLALCIVAQTQKQGGIAAYIDAEHAMDPEYAKNLGVDIDNLLISQPDSGEQALEIADKLVRSGGDRCHRYRFGRRAGAQGGDRRRNGRFPCRPAGPADEPGAEKTDFDDLKIEDHRSSSSTRYVRRSALCGETPKRPRAALL